MSAPRIFVDRIEGNVAVVEIAGQTVDLPVSLLPEGTREGSVLRLVLAQSSNDAQLERLRRLQADSGISDDFTL